jgi:cytochrome bd ubiquinol oxidase subunit I
VAVRYHGGVPHDLPGAVGRSGDFRGLCYGAYYKTGNPVYLQMFRFWRSIFAIGFALGIVSGILLTFELGLNWGNYARAVGPILGPMICMEALMAFFLEAGFGLFGRHYAGRG